MPDKQEVQVSTGSSSAGNETVKATVAVRTAEATQKTNDQMNSNDAAALRRAAEAAAAIKKQGR